MNRNVQLLIIDPQHDFCDPTGSLFVPGAVEDMERVATFIDKHVNEIADIHVTLDSHHFIDVAHPSFWVDSGGKHPDPFTIISADNVRNAVWTPVKPGLTRRMIDYVEALEAGGRYPLCIWPPHCLIGTLGQTVVPSVSEALYKWEAERFGVIDYVTKGSNIYTEHFGAIQAEVPDPSDPSTQLNVPLVQVTESADVLLLMGEAGSHCTANTGRDLVKAFGDNTAIEKVVFLTDGASPVPGFEQFQTDFINDMTALGMKTSTTVDFTF